MRILHKWFTERMKRSLFEINWLILIMKRCVAFCFTAYTVADVEVFGETIAKEDVWIEWGTGAVVSHRRSFGNKAVLYEQSLTSDEWCVIIICEDKYTTIRIRFIVWFIYSLILRVKLGALIYVYFLTSKSGLWGKASDCFTSSVRHNKRCWTFSLSCAELLQAAISQSQIEAYF